MGVFVCVCSHDLSMCVFPYVYEQLGTCVHICMARYGFIYVCVAHTFTFMHFCVCAVISVCVEVSLHGFMCVHTHIFLCVHMILCECDGVVLSRVAACVHGSLCSYMQSCACVLSCFFIYELQF